MIPVLFIMHCQIDVLLRVLIPSVVPQPHIVALVRQQERQRAFSQTHEVGTGASDAVQQEDWILFLALRHVVVGDAVHRQDIAVLCRHFVLDDWVAALVDDLGLRTKDSLFKIIEGFQFWSKFLFLSSKRLWRQASNLLAKV